MPAEEEYGMTIARSEKQHMDPDAWSPASLGVGGGPELTIVVPTFNEKENVGLLVERLDDVLSDISWEVIFVDDDSPDGTSAEVRRLARIDRRVRSLHRIGRRGLSSACIEGVLASAAPLIAIMDGDLQHDERLLPAMVSALRTEPLDLVIGSRYVPGGGISGLDRRRASISGIATRLGRLILKVEVADPMSGFFMVRREAFDRAARQLSAVSFKILVDLLASSPTPLRLRELPYEFRERRFGESKLDMLVVWEYLMLLADKAFGHIVPVRFVLFSLVGLVGVAAHLIMLWLGLNLAGLSFPWAQGIATGTAMVGNFTLNNVFTYRDRRLKGWGFLRGLISFALVCAVGAVGNIGIASFLFGRQESWWVAGLVGAAMSSVWNYAVSAVVTWKRT
jgi:dolichol-phosphate mannosyltransferase